eukprot:CAMPEP_0174877614 /NCGR_PEP_ID=MMETSP1114-20130205/82207_1 /TAXON_ID=312471 /ORGANISM="Neobodo designis, Strain CCAP 1951/1" /LENGTH=53 /DNA_ID=CAMNT_0016112997 /DNA_START=8 /DNA_END=169 /DNA_ORIENTATION=+
MTGRRSGCVSTDASAAPSATPTTKTPMCDARTRVWGRPSEAAATWAIAAPSRQ